MAVAAVVVALLAVLLVADRVAVIHVQGRIAAHVGDWGFPAGPQVRIAGFPFLPQLAAGRLSRVRASGHELHRGHPLRPFLAELKILIHRY